MTIAKIACLTIALIVSVCTSRMSNAAVVNVLSETSDQAVWGNGGANFVGQTTERIGHGNATRQGNAFVAVFALPTLTVGETISSADLQLSVLSTNGPFGGDPAWNMDVYGVRTSNSNAVSTSDFFIGASDASSTIIEDDFLASTSGVGTFDLSMSGESALTSWLNSLYTDITPNDAFAFIRFNGDLSPQLLAGDGLLPANRYFTVGTANNALPANIPLLSITTSAVAVPEPSSWMVLALGALGLWKRRSQASRLQFLNDVE